MAERPEIKTAARLGEAWSTSPLALLDVDNYDWLILMACAEVLRTDALERERQRKIDQGDIGAI